QPVLQGSHISRHASCQGGPLVIERLEQFILLGGGIGRQRLRGAQHGRRARHNRRVVLPVKRSFQLGEFRLDLLKLARNVFRGFVRGRGDGGLNLSDQPLRRLLLAGAGGQRENRG